MDKTKPEEEWKVDFDYLIINDRPLPLSVKKKILGFIENQIDLAYYRGKEKGKDIEFKNGNEFWIKETEKARQEVTRQLFDSLEKYCDNRDIISFANNHGQLLAKRLSFIVEKLCQNGKGTEK